MGVKRNDDEVLFFFVFSENWDKGGLTPRHHLGVFVCGCGCRRTRNARDMFAIEPVNGGPL